MKSEITRHDGTKRTQFNSSELEKFKWRICIPPSLVVPPFTLQPIYFFMDSSLIHPFLEIRKFPCSFIIIDFKSKLVSTEILQSLILHVRSDNKLVFTIKFSLHSINEDNDPLSLDNVPLYIYCLSFLSQPFVRHRLWKNHLSHYTNSFPFSH